MELLQHLGCTNTNTSSSGSSGSGCSDSTGSDTNGPKPALAALDSTVSVLLNLAFSSPRPKAPLVGLPGLESAQLEDCMQQARVLSGAPLADPNSSDPGMPATFAPAAGSAISLLQQHEISVPGSSAASTVNGLTCGSCTTTAATAAAADKGPPSWGNPALTALMLQAGPPPRQQWEAALGSASLEEASRLALTQQARAQALRRLAAREPGAALPALPGQLTVKDVGREKGYGRLAALGKVATWGGKQERLAAGSGRQQLGGGLTGGASYDGVASYGGEQHGCDVMAVEAESELQAVRVACLGLQGVCSAVDQLRELAAGSR